MISSSVSDVPKSLTIVLVSSFNLIMNCCNTNGRVNIMDQNTSAVFTLSDHIPVNDKSDFREALNGSWIGLKEGNGLFYMTPLSKKQIINLREKHSIYMLENGRINIAGLEVDKIKYFANITKEL